MKANRSFVLLALIAISSLANAEVNGGTGAPQDAVTLLDWLLGWLPF